MDSTGGASSSTRLGDALCTTLAFIYKGAVVNHAHHEKRDIPS